MSIVAFFWVAAHEEGGERHGRRRLPDQRRSGSTRRGPSTQTATRLANGRSRNWPPRSERARLELGEERGLERVEADQRMVVEQQRVGLHGARLASATPAIAFGWISLPRSVRVALRPGIIVSANACSVASARLGAAAAGAAAARIRSATGSAREHQAAEAEHGRPLQDLAARERVHAAQYRGGWR